MSDAAASVNTGRPASRGMRVLVGMEGDVNGGQSSTPRGQRSTSSLSMSRGSNSPDIKMFSPGKVAGGRSRARRGSFIGERPPSVSPDEAPSLDGTLESVGWEHAESFMANVDRQRRASVHRDMVFEIEKLTKIPRGVTPPPPVAGSPMGRSTRAMSPGGRAASPSGRFSPQRSTESASLNLSVGPTSSLVAIAPSAALTSHSPCLFVGLGID